MSTTKTTLNIDRGRRSFTRTDLNGDGSVRGTPTKSVIIPPNEYSYFDTRVGDENPYWREQVARRENATTTLEGNRYRVDLLEDYYCHAEYTATVAAKSYKGTISEGFIRSTDYIYPSLSTFSSSVLDEATNSAKMRFLSEVIEAQRRFQGGVGLGELRETLRMIKHPAQGLRKAIDHWHTRAMKLRRQRIYIPPFKHVSNQHLDRVTYEVRARRAAANSRVNRELVKDLGDMWLENAFGLQPLINDINDGVSALGRLLRGPPPTVFVSATGRADKQVSFFTQTIAGTLHDIIEERYISNAASVRYFGLVEPSYAEPTTLGARFLGFSAQDFLPTLWELTPWSFLIDYFSNIGKIIEGASWGRVGLKWSYATDRKSVHWKRAYRPKPKTNTRIVASRPQLVHLSNTGIYRRQYFGGFTPSVVFRVPGVDSLKWINMAALLASRRREWSVLG